MDWFPDAVKAALIGGGVSVLGLIISHQSKISEFRQQWIDGLRQDVSKLVGHSLLLVDVLEPEERKSHVRELNKLTARIRLRLNPKEDESKALLAALLAFRVKADKLLRSELNDAAETIVFTTQTVLKQEWRRVKWGEVSYRITVGVAIAAVVIPAELLLRKNHLAVVQFFKSL